MAPMTKAEVAIAHRRRRARMAALAILGGVCLAGLAISPESRAESKPMPPTHSKAHAQKQHGMQGPPRSVAFLNEGQRLALAYTAVFGVRKVDGVKSGDYSYSGGKVMRVGKMWVFLAPANHLEAYPINMGALGIFYLAESNGKYVVKGRWPEFVGGSIMGNPPEWAVRDDLTDYPVIVSTAGGVWQGYMCQNTTLTELRPDAPHVVADFQSHYSDGGAKSDGEPTTEIDGKIGTAVKSKSFDVRFEGTRSFTHRFTRTANGKFVREPHAETVPTC